MLSTFLDKAGDLLSRRFLIAYWFPTLFASLLLLLSRILVYGPQAAWNWWAGLVASQDYGGEGSLQIGLLVGSLLLITLIAYLLQSFTRPLVRTFEGYTWPSPLRRLALGRTAHRWHTFKEERTAAAKQNDLALYSQRQDQLHHEYPNREWLLLPTRLGNVLRAAEGYSSQAYGIDGPLWWPRLWPLLPEKTQSAVEAELTALLSLLNFAALMVYVSLDTAIYLCCCQIPHRGWWATGALALGILLAVAAYRGAVAQARSYGQLIRTAFDLHRFELLKALHMPLPATPQEERTLWSHLASWLYNNDHGAAQSLRYDVAKPKEEEKPDEAKSTHRSFWQWLWGK